jgi:hypothetical protein
MRRVVPLVVILAACGRPSSSEKAPARRDDAAVAPGDAAVALRPLALGMPEVTAFAYRRRAGQPAYRLARASEARGEWDQVAVQCRQALAADPDHLGAAYLYAVALAKTGGSSEQIVRALGTAVAGDYAKWGEASLAQPALQPFLASTLGQAWRRRVEQERSDFAAALARSLIVTADHDLYGYDGGTKRWLRLTRTGGAVVGALLVRSHHRLAYVTRSRVTTGGAPHTRVGLGVVDLATGHTRRSIELPAEASAKLRIGYNEKKTPGFIVRAGKRVWQLVEGDRLELHRVPAKAHADAPAYLAEMMRLEVAGRRARIDRTAVPDVSADWDDHSLASAIKIGRSKKVVTVPSPGLIDGDTAAWSADHTQLAFIAQLSDVCEPGVATGAAFVADAATGRVRELERAISGLAIEWSGERTLAIAGDHGVSIVSLDGGAPVVLAGADGLVTPRRTPTCTPEVPGEDPVVEVEDAR